MTRSLVRSLFTLGGAGLLLAAAFGAQAARADLTVRSGGSTAGHTQTTADAFVLDVGGTVATVQFASTPLCAGLACGIDGPAVSATLLPAMGQRWRSDGPLLVHRAGGPDPVQNSSCPASTRCSTLRSFPTEGRHDRHRNARHHHSLASRRSRSSRFATLHVLPERVGAAQNCRLRSFPGRSWPRQDRPSRSSSCVGVVRGLPRRRTRPASAYIDSYFEIDPA